MRRVILLTVLAMVVCMPGAGENRKPARLKKWWIASAAVVAGATFLDAYTSAGKLERNPLMRGANGQFSPARGIALKSGVSGALLLMQALLNRNGGQEYKTSIIANL